MKPFEIPWNPTTLTPWNTQSKGKNFSGKVYSFRASLDEKVSDLKELTVPWPWGHSFLKKKYGTPVAVMAQNTSYKY